MKINPLNRSLSFQKYHVANCGVIKEGVGYPCKIYQLLKSEDSDYFKKLVDTPDWYHANYTFIADAFLNGSWEYTEPVFVLEDKDENCLGYCVVDSSEDDVNTLEYIETVPKSTFGKENRPYEHIGETLLSFLCKFTAPDKNKKGIYIKSYERSARPFYTDKCGFNIHITPKRDGLFLRKKDFNSLVSKNEQKTGFTIDIKG